MGGLYVRPIKIGVIRKAEKYPSSLAVLVR
jgi:hypothetical protein